MNYAQLKQFARAEIKGCLYYLQSASKLPTATATECKEALANADMDCEQYRLLGENSGQMQTLVNLLATYRDLESTTDYDGINDLIEQAEEIIY